MGDDRAVTQRRRTRAHLNESDRAVLRDVVMRQCPPLLRLLDSTSDLWSKEDVAALGFAIGREVLAVGMDSEGGVNRHGEELEALFSRLPQHE